MMLTMISVAPMIQVADVLHLASVCSDFRGEFGWTQVRAIAARAARTCIMPVPMSLEHLLPGPGPWVSGPWVFCAHAARHKHAVSQLIAESPREFDGLARRATWQPGRAFKESSRSEERERANLSMARARLRQFDIDPRAPLRRQGPPGDPQAPVRPRGPPGAGRTQRHCLCFAWLSCTRRARGP